MKALAAILLALVCGTSTLAMAKGKKSTKESTKCSSADKKAGKCGDKKATNVSATVAAPKSVRKDSMDNSNKRLPASVMESNTH